MVNNILKYKKTKYILVFLFVSLCLFIAQIIFLNKNSVVEPQEEIGLIDLKLGQLSNTGNNLVEGSTVAVKSTGLQTVRNIKSNLINTADPISTSAGKAGGENCSLTLNFKLDKGTVLPHSNSNYTMYIKNTGREQCNNTSVSVYYSNNQSFVSSNPKPSASNYYWILGDLSSNDAKTVSFSTLYKEGDLSSNDIPTEVCVTADDSEDVCGSLTSSLAKDDKQINGSTPVYANLKNNETDIFFNSNTREYGTWVWTSPYAMSTSYRDKIISGSVANKINVIYITIDDYLAINNLPEGSSKEIKKKKYSDSLQSFIALANKNNIKVDVEAGWRDWAESPNTNKANVIIDYAIEYNNSYKNKIRGVQFDVEPYLLSHYEQNKASILVNFVNFVHNASNRLGSNKLALSVVIPHFYDSSQKWTPAITYNNSKDYTFNHILNILDRRPGSSIILMSYRNTSKGDDGSIKISKTEIDQASSGNHSTKVIVAQETGNVEPDYVTFYKTSKNYYINQINTINNEFKNKTNFGGISVHYIDPLLEL